MSDTRRYKTIEIRYRTLYKKSVDIGKNILTMIREEYLPEEVDIETVIINDNQGTEYLTIKYKEEVAGYV